MQCLRRRAAVRLWLWLWRWAEKNQGSRTVFLQTSAAVWYRSALHDQGFGAETVGIISIMSNICIIDVMADDTGCCQISAAVVRSQFGGNQLGGFGWKICGSAPSSALPSAVCPQPHSSYRIRNPIILSLGFPWHMGVIHQQVDHNASLVHHQYTTVITDHSTSCRPVT